MTPDNKETPADFRNLSEQKLDETLQVELETYHNMLLHIGPRIHILRSIINSRKPNPEETL